METTKLSSKGQMIIPKRIRDQLALKPGADLRVELIDAQSFTVRIDTELSHKAHVERLAGCLKQPGRRRPLSIAEMDAAVMKIARKQDERTKSKARR